MTAVKILYVDDEAMALKYFERLVSPLAPVLTANSVEAGRAVLREQTAFLKKKDYRFDPKQQTWFAK